MKQVLHVQCEAFSTQITMDLDSGFVADANTRHYVATLGTPEPEVVSAMHHILRPGDFAVDGGANIRYFSLVMAMMVGASGKVLAFEPGENNISKLRTNVGLNTGNIAIHPAPLWKMAEPVTLYYAQDSGRHSLRAADTYGSKELLATTIDDQNIYPRLIKLDIEGSEFDALSGAVHTIVDAEPYVICELNNEALVRFGHSDKALRDLMHDAFGYETFMLHRTLPAPLLLPRQSRLVTPYANTNVLFASIDMVGSAWPEIRYV